MPLARIIPALQPHRCGQPGNVDQHHRAGAGPLGQLAIERLDHRERRPRLDPVEAAEQRLHRRDQGLHQDRRPHGGAQALDHANDLLESAGDLDGGLLRIRRGAVQPQQPAVGDDQHHVQPGGADRAVGIGGLLQRRAIFPLDDPHRRAVPQGRSGDRRPVQGQGGVADDAQSHAVQACNRSLAVGHGAGQPRQPGKLSLIERRRGERHHALREVAAHAAGELRLEPAQIVTERRPRRRQPRQIAQHCKEP